MAKTGKKRKVNLIPYLALKELDCIIEQFGYAMRNANKEYISILPECHHDRAPRFTPNMDAAWAKYVEWCRRNPNG